MWRATGVEPTNETAATSGCVSSASTASGPPLTTLKTPAGRPASSSSSATSIDADGTCSLGLSTNALPAASATGYIHIGTITGKLNGVMPAATPSGWRMRVRVDAAGDLGRHLALEQLADPAGELDDLEAALHLAARVVEHLAVLARDDAGEVVAVAVDQLAEAEQHRRAAADRGRRPTPAPPAAAVRTTSPTSPASASGMRATTSPVAESVTSEMGAVMAFMGAPG